MFLTKKLFLDEKNGSIVLLNLCENVFSGLNMSEIAAI